MSDAAHFVCRVMWLGRIVSTGLQTIHMNFTNALCIVQKWQCGVQFLSNGIIGPCFFENAEAHTLTLIAHLNKVMLGTFLWNELLSHQLHRVGHCSHNIYSHASPQYSVCRQTAFLFWEHHLATLLPDLVVPDYFLWGYITGKVHETCLANIDGLKQHIWECIQRFLRKCYSVLWQPFCHACRSVLNNMIVSYKVSYSNGNDSDEFSWTWSLLTNVNKIFPLALKCYYIPKVIGCFLDVLQ